MILQRVHIYNLTILPTKEKLHQLSIYQFSTMEILTVQPLIFPRENSQYSNAFPKGNMFCIAIFFPLRERFLYSHLPSSPPLLMRINSTIG